MMGADEFCEACERHTLSVEQITAALDAGQPVDALDGGYFGGTPLSYAAQAGHAGIVQALLAAAAQPDLPDRSVIMMIIVLRAAHAAAVLTMLWLCSASTAGPRVLTSPPPPP